MFIERPAFSGVHPEAFRKAFLGSYEWGTKTSSPFRIDNDPSFIIYPRSDGIYWEDRGNGESGDAVSYVMKLKDITFSNAVDLLKQVHWDNYQDVAENIHDVVGRKKHTIITWTTREPGDTDYAYLKRNYTLSKTTNDTIDLLLAAFRWEVADYVYINGDLWHTYTPWDPVYVLRLSDTTVKVYRPLAKNKEDKWRSQGSDIGFYSMDMSLLYNEIRYITSHKYSAALTALKNRATSIYERVANSFYRMELALDIRDNSLPVPLESIEEDAREMALALLEFAEHLVNYQWLFYNHTTDTIGEHAGDYIRRSIIGSYQGRYDFWIKRDTPVLGAAIQLQRPLAVNYYRVQTLDAFVDHFVKGFANAAVQKKFKANSRTILDDKIGMLARLLLSESTLYDGRWDNAFGNLHLEEGELPGIVWSGADILSLSKLGSEIIDYKSALHERPKYYSLDTDIFATKDYFFDPNKWKEILTARHHATRVGFLTNTVEELINIGKFSPYHGITSLGYRGFIWPLIPPQVQSTIRYDIDMNNVHPVGSKALFNLGRRVGMPTMNTTCADAKRLAYLSNMLIKAGTGVFNRVNYHIHKNRRLYIVSSVKDALVLQAEILQNARAYGLKDPAEPMIFTCDKITNLMYHYDGSAMFDLDVSGNNCLRLPTSYSDHALFLVPPSETANIDSNLISNLIVGHGVTEIVIVFDNDIPGRNSAISLANKIYKSLDYKVLIEHSVSSYDDHVAQMFIAKDENFASILFNSTNAEASNIKHFSYKTDIKDSESNVLGTIHYVATDVIGIEINMQQVVDISCYVAKDGKDPFEVTTNNHEYKSLKWMNLSNG